MQAPAMQQFVDRTTPQGGATSLRHPSNINVVYNAEIQPAGCSTRYMFCLTCRCYNHSRSYLYLRENSIETNEGADHMCKSSVQCLVEVLACPLQRAYDFLNFTVCCCMCPESSIVRCARGLPCLRQDNDNVNVVYFYRDYFESSTEGCCCVQENTPKLEVVDKGYMCCCIRCAPICNLLCPCVAGPSKEVVIMPYESRKCCWCCDISNRVGCCDNCCGLCGKVTGSPVVCDSFYPQPKNVEAFVTIAQPLVASRQNRGAPASLPADSFFLQRLQQRPVHVVSSSSSGFVHHHTAAPAQHRDATHQPQVPPRPPHHQHVPAPPAPPDNMKTHASASTSGVEASDDDARTSLTALNPATKPSGVSSAAVPTRKKPPPPPQDDVVDDEVNAAALEAPIGNIKITRGEMKIILEQRGREIGGLAVDVSSVPEGGITEKEMEMVMRSRKEPPPPPQDDVVDDEVNAAAPEAPIGNIKITRGEMKIILEQRGRETGGLAVDVSLVPEGGITEKEMEMVMMRRRASASTKYD